MQEPNAKTNEKTTCELDICSLHLDSKDKKEFSEKKEQKEQIVTPWKVCIFYEKTA